MILKKIKNNFTKSYAYGNIKVKLYLLTCFSIKIMIKLRKSAQKNGIKSLVFRKNIGVVT